MKHGISATACRGPLASVIVLLSWILASASIWAGGTPEALPLMPNGSGSPTENGDTISSSAGLDEPYRFWIEVPPGLGQLGVELFDADVGVGGGSEADPGRDRARGSFDTTATYTLTDSLGFQCAQLSCDDSTCSDNSWTTLYSSVYGCERTTETVRDEFTTDDYSGNHGTQNWGTDWVEDDSGGPSGGEIYIVNSGSDSFLRIDVDGLIIDESHISREVDLSSSGLNFQNATLTFDYAATITLLAQFTVEISADGGSNYTQLAVLAAGSGTPSFDISSFISDETRVRFRGRALTGLASGFILVDDVQISGGVPTGGLPPGHWELTLDHSSSVTSGDDINAIGVRAHDGDESSSGIEINIYSDGFLPYGANTGASESRTYTHYPWVSSGCDLDLNDFDWDGGGSFELTPRGAGSTVHVDGTPSGNDAWQNSSVTGWTDDEDATGYGIWTGTFEIDTGANYGTLYVGAFDAAAPPPSTQPEANTFPLYLPTDGGTAPLKPYLEQQVRHFSGPNPPDNGSTSTVTVTVRLVNPTAHSITFSASNLVTVNVPGSGVLYAGNPQLSQGTLVSQPSIGGSGDITWNPGTVTTGATEILSYDVEVTPTLDGQTLVVTGTPGSNGTTASYVDETCTGASPACSGTQLTRATATLGELCQLSVTENALTYVKIDRFDSFTSREGLVLEWESASEAGTMSYELWRAEGNDWVAVEGGQIPALFGAPQGGVYRVVDRDGGVGDQYALVELDRRGETSTHGPYEAAAQHAFTGEMMTSSTAEALLPVSSPNSKSARLTKPGTIFESGDLQSSQSMAGGRSGRGRTPLASKLAVQEPGLYHVSAASLANALGRTAAWIENQIDRGGLRLTNSGQSIPWAAAAGNSGIYFYGEAIDSLYTRDNIYILSAAAGSQMTTFPLVSVAPDPNATYPTVDRHEVDSFAALVLGLDPESDYWYWAGLTAGNASYDTWSGTVPASALGTGAAQLSISVLGSTLTGPGGSHEADVFLNGDYLTTESWSGADHTIIVPVNTLDLVDGDNTISLRALLPTGVNQSFVFVDHAELTYDRHYVAVGDSLAFEANGNGAITLDGFSGNVILLDITDPRHPQLATGGSASTFQPPNSSGSYLAVGPNAVREVSGMQPLSTRDLLASPADDIFLVPSGIEHSVDDLMAHRQSQGLDVARVTLDELMDQFNHGIVDPRAIRTFLVAAETAWGSAPEYLTLVGTGHYDYRDIYGVGGQLMPPLLIATSNGLYASDDAYGDLDGDGLAEVAVGRIPVTDFADMWYYTQKVIAYESAEPSSDILLISDGQRPGEALDFASENARLASHLGPVASVSQLDLGTLGIGTLRTQMFDELAAGPAFVNYFGHGAADVWSDSAILTRADLPGLSGPPAVYTGLTCLMNRFEVTGFESLGAGLLLAEGGAVASWSPTSPEAHAVSRVLGERFYQRIRNHDWSESSLVLGDLVRDIRRSGAAGQGADVLSTYLLMGDPALILRFEPVPEPPISNGGD